MNVIVAVDTEWGIGKNNQMLFHLPDDLSFFRAKTLGKVIVMGGNTLLSFPGSKPLPRRTNIVLSDVFTRDDCLVVPTLDELKEELKKYDEDTVFVVGGSMFYNTMLPYCKTAYITKVDSFGDATHFFPNLDQNENWEVLHETAPTVTNGHTIRFVTYQNRFPKQFI